MAQTVYTLDFFKELTEKRNITILSDSYKNLNTKFDLKCNNCDNTWQTTPQKLVYRNRGCPVCKKKQAIEKIRKKQGLTLEVFQKLAKERGGECLSTEYVNKEAKLKFKCGTCNNIWETSGGDVKHRGHWCPKCAVKKNKNNLIARGGVTIDFFKDYAEKNSGKCLTDVYDGGKTRIEFQCNKCKNIWNSSASNIKKKESWCPKCALYKSSKSQKQMFTWIKSEFEDATDNYKYFKKKEIDAYIPSKNLGIEFNGLYWHSEKFYDKNYHFEKRKLTKELGIDLLQINADEWYFKQNIVKSIIRTKAGVVKNKYFARKLTIKEVKTKDAIEFLKTNHLMGEYRSAKHLGLFLESNLVSLISYKKHKNGIDISRFCNKLDTIVIGGLSKLLSEIEKRENPAFIQSWVDLRYGNGSSLEKIGYIKQKEVLSWKWTDGYNSYNRLKCRANMDKRRLSEKEYAKELGWLRVYDAGQALFVKTFNI
jgi:Zn finger protein HypA/HybF involved in hydrogenase expression